MRDILFLSHRIPYPPDKGDKIRSWHILQHLLRRYRVHLGCLVDDKADFAHVPMMSELCESCCFANIDWLGAHGRMAGALAMGKPLTFAHFRKKSLAAWVAALHRSHDISAQLIYSSAAAPYVEPIPGFRGMRIVDFVDVDSDKWAQYARSCSWPLAWIYAREARLLASAERRIAESADISLFASEDEAAFFRSRGGNSATVLAMPNGVDTTYFDPSLDFSYPFGMDGEGPALVFVGRMDYWANVDAVQWFTREVLPFLKQSVPSVRLFIVGAEPTRAVRALGRIERVVVTGRVPDVRPYLAHAALVLAPLRIARGIQNKALEAMAMAKAVVATPQAFEGIEAEPGRDIVVADGGPAFAAATIELLADRQAVLHIGARARATAVANYGWKSRLAILDRLLEPIDEVPRRAAFR